MLALSPSQRILLAVQPVDFRKGIDGLIGLCRQRLNENPLLGTLFVFTNRRRTALKLLIYDGQGFFLILKRFSQGRLHWWPDGPEGVLSASVLGIVNGKGSAFGFRSRCLTLHLHPSLIDLKLDVLSASVRDF